MNQQIASQLEPTARIFCGINTTDNKYNIEPVVVEPKKKKVKAKRGPKPTKIDFDTLKRLYDDQWIFTKMGEYFGLSPATVFLEVSSLLEKGKLVKRERNYKAKIFIPQDEFVNAYNAGYLHDELAKMFCVSLTKIQSTIKELVGIGMLTKRKRGSKGNV